MPKRPQLAALLTADAIVFGLFPAYMVAHMFAFQVVPGPSVAPSELFGLVQAVFYMTMYPLEMWGPWLLFPALAAPLSATAILILSASIWRGRLSAALPLVLVVAAYNALELIAGGYALSLMFLNDTPPTIAVGTFLFALRIALACLVVAINAKLLLHSSRPKDPFPAA